MKRHGRYQTTARCRYNIAFYHGYEMIIHNNSQFRSKHRLLVLVRVSYWAHKGRIISQAHTRHLLRRPSLCACLSSFATKAVSIKLNR